MTYEEINTRSVVVTLSPEEVRNALTEAALAVIPGQPISRFSPNVSHSLSHDAETGGVTVRITVNHNQRESRK